MSGLPHYPPFKWTYSRGLYCSSCTCYRWSCQLQLTYFVCGWTVLSTGIHCRKQTNFRDLWNSLIWVNLKRQFERINIMAPAPLQNVCECNVLTELEFNHEFQLKYFNLTSEAGNGYKEITQVTGGFATPKYSCFVPRHPQQLLPLSINKCSSGILFSWFWCELSDEVRFCQHC